MTATNPLDQHNQAWRSSPLYREAFAAVGASPDGPVRLTDQQRELMRAFLKSKGVEFPDGLEIDPAGNFNEPEGFGKQAKKWGPVVGAAALTAFGIPGVMPGLLTGGGAAGAGAAGAAGAAGGGTGAAAGGFSLGSVLPFAIGAGANLAGTFFANRSANNAAQTQQRATDRVLDLQERQYNDAKAMLTPYHETGVASLPQLRAMASRPAPNLPASVARVVGPMGMPVQGQPAPPAGAMSLNDMRSGRGAYAQTDGRPMASAGSGQAPAAQAGGFGDLVKMQAPSGAIAMVRPEAVDKYLARGAQVIG